MSSSKLTRAEKLAKLRSLQEILNKDLKDPLLCSDFPPAFPANLPSLSGANFPSIVPKKQVPILTGTFVLEENRDLVRKRQRIAAIKQATGHLLHKLQIISEEDEESQKNDEIKKSSSPSAFSSGAANRDEKHEGKNEGDEESQDKDGIENLSFVLLSPRIVYKDVVGYGDKRLNKESKQETLSLGSLVSAFVSGIVDVIIGILQCFNPFNWWSILSECGSANSRKETVSRPSSNSIRPHQPAFKTTAPFAPKSAPVQPPNSSPRFSGVGSPGRNGLGKVASSASPAIASSSARIERRNSPLFR